MANILKAISSRRIILVLAGILGLLGGMAVIYATSNGPWGYSDSVVYLVSARNLLRGLGLGYFFPSGKFYIVTTSPPLYPLVLAGIGLLRVDLIDAARWLNIFLFVATIYSSAAVFIAFGSSAGLAILASLLVGIFPVMLMMFSSSMSEPVFIFLFIWSGFCLLWYLKYENPRWFILSALFAGLLPITRYIGIAVTLTAVVCIFLFSSRPWKVRLKKTILYGLLAGLPIFLWIAFVYFGVDRSVAGRGLQINGAALPVLFKDFRALFLDTVWKWIPFRKYPSDLPYWLRYVIIGVTVVAVTVVTWLARRRVHKNSLPLKPGSEFQLFTFFGLTTVAFVIVLALTYIFLLPTPDVDDRILLPLYAGTVLCLLGAFACWQRAWFHNGRAFTYHYGKGWLRVLPCLIAMLFIYWYYPQAVSTLELYHTGEGITAFYWRNSETMRAVRDLPDGLPIVSNNAAAILLWADRPAYELMEVLPPEFIEQSTPYGSDTSDRAQAAFRQQGAALVIFEDQFRSQLERAFGEKGLARLDTFFSGLVISGQYADGILYYYPK